MATTTETTTLAWIALGSNLGDRRRAIEAAVNALRADARLRVVAVSSLHETEPVGAPHPGQGRYLNGAAALETTLEPMALLESLLAIERRLGRVRAPGVRNEPRVIDLDLLLAERAGPPRAAIEIDEPGLTLPHPRMHERRFVLAPLAEIAPDLQHPTLDRTIRELAKALP